MNNNEELNRKVEANRLKNRVDANRNSIAKTNTSVPPKLSNPSGGIRPSGPELNNSKSFDNSGADSYENMEEQSYEDSYQNNLVNNIENSKQNIESTIEKVKKVKKIAKILPIIGGVMSYILPVVLIASAILAPSLLIADKLESVISFGDKVLNLITGDGFNKSSELITNVLNDAEKNYNKTDYAKEGTFDSGILLTTIHHNNTPDASIYFSDDELGHDDYDSNKIDIGDFALDNDQTWSFYTAQKELLGSSDFNETSNSSKGLIYYLVDYKINWQCGGLDEDGKPIIKTEEYLTTIANMLLLSIDKTFSSIGDSVASQITVLQIINFLKESIAFRDQGMDYSVYLFNSEIYAAFKDKDNVKRNLFLNFFSKETCQAEYNGKVVKYGPTPSVVKYMNYSSYFNYLKNVYIPINYFCKNCLGSDLDAKAKEQFSLDMIENIVDERNAYYSALGENNYLFYDYNEEDGFITNLLTSSYIGDIPVGTKGTGWGQRDERWANIPLGNSNMGDVGCYVTSIAILMANSGTQINSEYFDPGVLATHLSQKGAFNSSGSMTKHAWTELVPKFHQIDSENVFSIMENAEYGYGKNYDALNNLISSKLQKGYYVQVELKGHFVAVAGIENGRVVISDPAGQGSVYLIDKIANFRDGAVRSIRVFGE